MLFSILFAISIPLLFLYIFWVTEVFVLTKRRWVFASLAWGAAMFLIAVAINNFLLRGITVYLVVVLVIAPVLEELIKAIFLLVLSTRQKITYSFHGVIYGFAIGTGFSVFENLFYIYQHPNSALEITLARVLSSSLMHATVSGFVGLMLGYVVLYGRAVRYQIFGLALALAILAHATYNLIISSDDTTLLNLVGIFFGLGGSFVLYRVVQQDLKRQRKEIQTHLLGELSSGELVALHQPEEVLEILEYYEGALGQDRAEQITQYINLQAQLGMLRKTLAETQRPELTQTIQSQITSVQAQANQVRQQLGVYTSAWLRSVLPSEESDVWQHLKLQVQDDNPLINLIAKVNTQSSTITKSEVLKRKALLKSSDLFKDLPDEDLTDIALLLQPFSAGVGTTIIQQGTFNQNVYLVAKGRLIVNVAGKNDSATILRVYVLSDTFGEIGLLQDEQKPLPSPSSVIVSEDAILYRLERADFLTLIYAKPQVSLRLMRQLINDTRRQTNIITKLRDSQETPVISYGTYKESHVFNVLVVDDDSDMLNMLKHILRSERYLLSFAKSTEEALHILQESEIDLMLLDVMLPTTNGLEFARELRQSSQTKNLPIIFVSALSDINTVMAGFEVGGVDYITKPFRPTEVVARVRNQIHLLTLRREVMEQRQQMIALLENTKKQ
jgi:CheY-like chemotaxis protein/RsiW-degrading membrane proteinase PrsW (M82 family)